MPLTSPPDALTVIAGTIGRNATLDSLLGKTLSPAARPPPGPGRAPHLRPGAPLRRAAVPAEIGPRRRRLGLHLRHRRAAHAQGEAQRQQPGGGARDPQLRDARRDASTGTITSSLFGAVSDAGEEPQLAVDLAAIFEWDVDFNTELQKGDSFRVAVEKQYLEGAFSRYGSILAAELLRGDRVLRAVRFDARRRAPSTSRPRGCRCARPSCARRSSSRASARASRARASIRSSRRCGRTSASTTRRPPARPCARPPTASSCSAGWSRRLRQDRAHPPRPRPGDALRPPLAHRR